MIVDSSALVALLVGEPAAFPLRAVLETETTAGVGAPTLVETSVVIESKVGLAGRALLAELLDELRIVVIPFEEAHARIAISAYARYGRGYHPAALNYGDCMSYAVARLAGEPLLCVGSDFALTDLELALP